MNEIIDEFKVALDKSIEKYKQDSSGIRAGRANGAILDSVRANVYGNFLPINQCANITIVDSLTLSLSIWDSGNVKTIEKAISESDLGFGVRVDGNNLILKMPPLTAERRQEFVKLLSKMTEDSRIAMRNIRRTYMDKIKKLEKNKELSQDDMRIISDKMQVIFDSQMQLIEDAFSVKKDEILSV